MEKIQELIEKLDKKLPSSFEKRLDGYNKLTERLKLAQSEHDAEPTEQSEESLAQIQEYVNDVEQDLIEDLEDLIEKRAKEEKETPPAPAPDPIPAEVIEEKEEKSGMSVFGVVLGVALLIGTAGAYNYFNKNR